MMPCTVSGRGSSSVRASTQVPVWVRRRKPRSASMRAYSPAYNGLPAARPSTAAWTSTGSRAWSSR
jgi:hypothetical protein